MDGTKTTLMKREYIEKKVSLIESYSLSYDKI